MVLMRSVRLAGCALAVALSTGCQLGGTPIEQRDGYFTWVDEQGQVRYSRIPETESESESPESEDVAETAGLPPKRALGEPDAASKLEEAGDYTTENYPDGEELARDGFIRPGQRQPYYTWRDADGIVRVSYYKPDTRTERQRNPDMAPLNLTPASVYLPRQESGEAEPVAGHDPDAFAVLGIEREPENVLTTFAGNCCEALSNKEFEHWQEGREFGVRITEDSPVYDFSSGESAFQLVALPSGEFTHGFVTRLRSYAHKGVFVPTLAFLDRDFRPVRLITDLVMDYYPETWRKRGYLEAWVPVFPGQGERWLLVLTRSEDLRAQTVYDADHGPVAIPHVPYGELGLTTFEE